MLSVLMAKFKSESLVSVSDHSGSDQSGFAHA
jgi:hypothetical protein